MWCRQCEQPVCGLCAFEGHNGEAHQVVSSKAIVKDKKNHIAQQEEKLKKVIDQIMNDSKYSVQNLMVNLINILKANTDIVNLNKELNKNTSLMKNAVKIETMLDCEAKIEILQAQANKINSSAFEIKQNSEAATVSEPGSSTSNCELQNGSKAKRKISDLMEELCTTAQSSANKKSKPTVATSVWPLTIGVTNGEGNWSKIIWEDRLLVPAFRRQFVEAHFTVQVSVLFFLSVFCSVVTLKNLRFSLLDVFDGNV